MSALNKLAFDLQATCDARNPDDTKRVICYNYDGNVISVLLPKEGRPVPTNKIARDISDFINGFKVVQLENGEYAYVRESDNQLLPFRYDIALPFNQYGFAMIGRESCVTWINSLGNILNNWCEFTPDTTPRFKGFEEVEDFSHSSIPLSKLCNGGEGYKNQYLTTDGKVKTFTSYNGVLYETNKFPIEGFSWGTSFNEDGYALSNWGVLFDDGVVCDLEDLLKICQEKGYLKEIKEDITKACQGIPRVLAKKDN